MAKKSKILKYQLSPEEFQAKIDSVKKEKKKYRVFYGYAKLTKKIVRKKELAIYYENSASSNNFKFVTQKIHIVYERVQTTAEMTDSDIGNRTFTKYGYFIDEKPWQGNIERILEQNFDAEKNHVSKKEREIIREKLRKEYFSFYKVEQKPKGQQALIFNMLL